MRNKFLLFPIIVVPLVGCLSVDTRLFEKSCAPVRRDWSTIELGYALPVPKHKYLGEIMVQYDSGYDREEIIRRLKREAAACGADGVVLARFSRAENAWTWADKNMAHSFESTTYRLYSTMYRYE